MISWLRLSQICLNQDQRASSSSSLMKFSLSGKTLHIHTILHTSSHALNFNTLIKMFGFKQFYFCFYANAGGEAERGMGLHVAAAAAAGICFILARSLCSRQTSSKAQSAVGRSRQGHAGAGRGVALCTGNGNGNGNGAANAGESGESGSEQWQRQRLKNN